MYCWPSFAQEIDVELEKEAKAIEGMLIAPCCWRQPVAVHYSPKADEIRSTIREMLRSGQSRQEILNSFVTEYGDKILAKPPARGFNLLAYLLPVLFLVLGAIVAVSVFRRLRPRRIEEREKKAKPVKLGSDYEDRIEREMWG
jgi:cytochrome c-type biogenesis protein CcmH